MCRRRGAQKSANEYDVLTCVAVTSYWWRKLSEKWKKCVHINLERLQNSVADYYNMETTSTLSVSFAVEKLFDGRCAGSPVCLHFTHALVDREPWKEQVEIFAPRRVFRHICPSDHIHFELHYKIPLLRIRQKREPASELLLPEIGLRVKLAPRLRFCVLFSDNIKITVLSSC